jgi:hypothetical protein
VIGDVMGATSTARSRHFRQRKRAGLVRLVVEVDEDGLCEWLVAGASPSMQRVASSLFVAV